MSRIFLLAVLLVFANEGWASDTGMAGYEVLLPEQLTLVEDVQTGIPLTIVVTTGMHIDGNAPLQVFLKAAQGSGLVIKKRRLARKDAGGTPRTKPRFTAQVRASKVGTSAISLSVRFWLCKASVCRPELVHRKIQIETVAAPAKQAERADST